MSLFGVTFSDHENTPIFPNFPKGKCRNFRNWRNSSGMLSYLPRRRGFLKKGKCNLAKKVNLVCDGLTVSGGAVSVQTIGGSVVAKADQES